RRAAGKGRRGDLGVVFRLHGPRPWDVGVPRRRREGLGLRPLPAKSVAVPLIELADVEAAARRIDGVAHRTPVVTSRTLGSHVFLKAENLQRTGSFKFRGACNKLSTLPEGRDVIAFSSGNHAQAVALAARLRGVRARSLAAGERVRIEIPRTIADGLGAPEPGELTWQVTSELVDEFVSVDDPDLVEAMSFLFDRVKLVVEPSGAAGVAAFLRGK